MTVNPFGDWSRSDGRIAKIRLETDVGASINVKQACESAGNILDTWKHITNEYAVPLYKEEQPEPTDEFVRYNPNKEIIKFYNKTKSRPDRASVDVIANSNLGLRLKWWLPEKRTEIETVSEDRLPPTEINPVQELNEQQSDEFFKEVREAVRRERRAEKQGKYETVKEMGIDQASNQASAKGPLQLIGERTYKGRQAFKFQPLESETGNTETFDSREESEIFPNNHYLLLVEGVDQDDLPEMDAVYVGNEEIWLAPQDGEIRDSSELYRCIMNNTLVWAYHLLNPVPYQRRLDGIQTIQNRSEKEEVVTGNRNIRFSQNISPPDPEIQLNKSQEDAFIWARSAKDCFCIHGPPGTGKTRTLTAIIIDAVARGQRVLATAHSNQAVNNLILGDSKLGEVSEGTVHEFAQQADSEFSISRPGSNHNSKVIEEYYQDVPPEGADIVAATTSGAAKFDPNSFDIAILDEATQASRAATAIAFGASKKLILAGDHKQLPPFSAGDDSFAEETRPSLFETLLTRYGDRLAIMLETQYRMNKVIAGFSNTAFYQGRLKTAEQNQNWTIDDFQPLTGFQIQGDEQTNSADSRYNKKEAQAAAKQAKILVENGLAPDDVAIISAYSGQVPEVNRYLSQAGIRSVTVDTIDSFQGSEREAIILTLVRSNDGNFSGFLTDPKEGPRRLNVALTRARKRLIVIGDWTTLGSDSDSRKSSCTHLYRDLQDYIQKSGELHELS